MTALEYVDVLIVGAGAGGSSLAARLSEDSERTVLLVDAGPDYPRIEDVPDELREARSMAGAFPGNPHNWGFSGEVVPGRTSFFPRGKLVGGSSAINGTYFIRGRQQDFDGWAADGNDLWSWDQVLPFFVKCETDLDFDDDQHGQTGPMSIMRTLGDDLRPVSQTFIDACVALGYPLDPDKNANTLTGAGPIPRNRDRHIRMSAAVNYLTDARDRPNLTVLGDTFVRTILFEGTRAVGVEAERDGQVVTLRAGEVVLSAGAFKTPHLLMLSGIGPAATLQQHGIEVLVDSPGVGQNLQDHPTVFVPYQVDPAIDLPESMSPFEACLHHTVSDESAGGVEGEVQISNGAIPMGPDSVALMLMCSLEAGHSRGEVTLESSDPHDAPKVSLNYLSDPADLPRLVANVKIAFEILRTPEYQAIGATILPGAVDDESDEALAAWISASVTSAAHSTSTARMGPDSDPFAVVDQLGRVKGVEGLRVCDISIMPRITRRGPAATAVMIGERIADLFDRTS